MERSVDVVSVRTEGMGLIVVEMTVLFVALFVTYTSACK
jgi:hypothetical protein